MPDTKVRVVGSGFTSFSYRGQIIAFLEGVEDSGQRAFSDAGQGYQFIHPLGFRHPIEIATSRVLAGGTLNLTIRELWNKNVWEHLFNLVGTRNIIEVFDRLAEDPSYLTCETIIQPPRGRPRGKSYQGCVVVDISDNDTITVGALAVTKGIVIAYTHTEPI